MTHSTEPTRFDVDAGPASDRWSSDPHRPRFHFLPPENWMNDPNGLIQWNGRYHMFYQHNPNGAFWGTMHWGHAVSDDLVHWTHLPIALAPTPDSVDQDGIFSGVAVNNNGVPTIIYTGVRGAVQLPCMAIGDDELVTWTKYEGNPIIASPPENLELVGFRDHSVWRDDDVWHQLIGAGIKDQGGTALLYRSHDLLEWEFVQPILIGDHCTMDPIRTGSMWECPTLFPLGDKHVLLVSVWNEHQTHFPIYLVGTYRDHTFNPQVVRMVDFGASFYAPQTFEDDHGRRIMFGWLRETRPVEQQIAAGWSGVMSLPWLLSLDDAGGLRFGPTPELRCLRGDHTHVGDCDLAADAPDHLARVTGDALEIIAEIERGDAREVGMKVRRSPAGEEETVVVYDYMTGILTVDCQRSSLDVAVQREAYTQLLMLSEQEPLLLHLFLDRSVLEVIANGRVLCTVRIYPTRADSHHIAFHVGGGTARLRSVDIWNMTSI